MEIGLLQVKLDGKEAFTGLDKLQKEMDQTAMRATRMENIVSTAFGKVNRTLKSISTVGAFKELDKGIDQTKSRILDLANATRSFGMYLQRIKNTKINITTQITKVKKIIETTFSRGVGSNGGGILGSMLGGVGSVFSGLLSPIKGVFGGIADAALSLGGKINSLITSFFSLRTVMIGVAAFYVFQRAIRTLANVVDEVEAGVVRLGAALGSIDAGKKKFEELRNFSYNMGQDIGQTIQSYSSFAVATKKTFGNLQDTDAFYRSMSEVGLVLGMNTEQTKRMFTAFTQMSSKGKLMAEELRNQLGEVLPGAFELAAESLGMTEKQLNRALERGEIEGEKLLKFFKTFSTLAKQQFVTPELLEAAKNRFTVVIRRFSELRIAFAQLFSEFVGPKLGKILNEVIDKLSAMSKSQTVKKIFQDIGTGIEKAYGVIKDMLELIKGGDFTGAVSKLLKKLGEGLSTYVNMIGSLYAIAIQAGTAFVFTIIENLPSILQKMKPMFDLFGTVIEGALKMISKAFTSGDTGGFGALGEGLRKIMEGIPKDIMGIGNLIVATLKSVFESIPTLFQQVAPMLAYTIKDALFIAFKDIPGIGKLMGERNYKNDLRAIQKSAKQRGDDEMFKAAGELEFRKSLVQDRIDFHEKNKMPVPPEWRSQATITQADIELILARSSKNNIDYTISTIEKNFSKNLKNIFPEGSNIGKGVDAIKAVGAEVEKALEGMADGTYDFKSKWESLWNKVITSVEGIKLTGNNTTETLTAQIQPLLTQLQTLLMSDTPRGDDTFGKPGMTPDKETPTYTVLEKIQQGMDRAVLAFEKLDVRMENLGFTLTNDLIQGLSQISTDIIMMRGDIGQSLTKLGEAMTDKIFNAIFQSIFEKAFSSLTNTVPTAGETMLNAAMQGNTAAVMANTAALTANSASNAASAGGGAAGAAGGVAGGAAGAAGGGVPWGAIGLMGAGFALQLIGGLMSKNDNKEKQREDEKEEAPDWYGYDQALTTRPINFNDEMGNANKQSKVVIVNKDDPDYVAKYLDSNDQVILNILDRNKELIRYTMGGS